VQGIERQAYPNSQEYIKNTQYTYTGRIDRAEHLFSSFI